MLHDLPVLEMHYHEKCCKCVKPKTKGGNKILLRPPELVPLLPLHGQQAASGAVAGFV